MKIMVALDGSAASQKGLEKAIFLARPHNAELLILAVVEPVLDYPLYPVGGAAFIEPTINGGEIFAEKKSHANKVLQDAAHLAKDLTHETRLCFGDARHLICDIAKMEDVDILVIGSRGLGAIGRLVLGSVSDYVMHHCHCAVLVVR